MDSRFENPFLSRTTQQNNNRPAGNSFNSNPFLNGPNKLVALQPSATPSKPQPNFQIIPISNNDDAPSPSSDSAPNYSSNPFLVRQPSEPPKPSLRPAGPLRPTATGDWSVNPPPPKPQSSGLPLPPKIGAIAPKKSEQSERNNKLFTIIFIFF